jgi:hypothetical protein
MNASVLKQILNLPLLVLSVTKLKTINVIIGLG